MRLTYLSEAWQTQGRCRTGVTGITGITGTTDAPKNVSRACVHVLTFPHLAPFRVYNGN